MNNKGFAISTILYGLMILFLMLFLSLLGILSQQKSNMEKLIENTNGARDIVNGSIINGEIDDREECINKCNGDNECISNCDMHLDDTTE